MVYGGYVLLRSHALYLALLTRYKGVQGITFGTGLVAGVTRSLSMLTANCLWGFTLDFIFRLTSIAFTMFGYVHKTTGV